MASFTPRQLEHAAWVLARVRHRPSPTWLDNFASALEVRRHAFYCSMGVPSHGAQFYSDLSVALVLRLDEITSAA